MINIRQGPYFSLPFVEQFGQRMQDTRDLNGLLERLGQESKSHLRIAIPFFQPEVINLLLQIWTNDNPSLRISILHRQGFRSNEDKVTLQNIMKKWSKTKLVEFRTLPMRNPVTGFFKHSEITFHCKMIDPGNGNIILLSSNLTFPAHDKNVEIGYVFSTYRARDFHLLINYLFEASFPDPFAILQ